MTLESISFVVRFDVNRTNPNRMTGLHWAARGARMTAARLAARMEWYRAGAPRVDCPVIVDVVIRRARALDPFNAAAAVKGCVDGIFVNGITPDDSSRWLTIGEVRQETGKEWKGREQVEFIVRPREDDQLTDHDNNRIIGK